MHASSSKSHVRTIFLLKFFAKDDRPYLVIPSPQGIETNLASERLESSHESIRRVEDQEVNLKCVIKPPPSAGDISRTLQWQYSRDDTEYSSITADGVEIRGDTLNIAQVKKAHRGYYQCTANDVSFNVLLRVKGECHCSL